MNSLRKQLRLSDSCSKEDLQKTCNRYYALYKGVMDSSAEASTKAIAQSKLDDLVQQAGQEGVVLDEMAEFNFKRETANINATVEQDLASMSGSLTGSQVNELNKKIGDLPHSAKRYYLSALVIMQSSNPSIESCREAANKLMTACSEDPENLAYPAALRSIQSEIEAYEGALEVWKKEQEEILRKRKAQHQRQEFWEGVKGVLGWIGAALLWLGGALLTVGSLAFNCMCGMFECCDIC